MSRVVVGWLHVLEPDMEQASECPCCRFDTLLTFPLVMLTDDGVSRAGEVRQCARCWREDCECCQ